MRVNESRDYVMEGWRELKPLLDSVRDISNDPWMKQYFPGSVAMDDYFNGSVDRFSLLLRVIAEYCPIHARV
ncbi:MAG: hypothetical protein Q9M09_06035, partial [Mariprofundaceae bacterium]|nr:hypothetical protein [Mariprofundaceae bacterium]